MEAESSTQTPENLWLLCSQLMSRTPNTLEKAGSYAWATLRASVLHSLSLLGSSLVSREAAELLLSLLTHISPSFPKQGAATDRKILRRSASTGTESSGMRDSSVAVESDSVSLHVNTDEGDSSRYTNAFASRIRESFTTMTATSSLLAVEAKWADENVAAPALLPFANPSSEAISLGCVWQSIRFQPCSIAQKECVERIISLRKTTSTTSSAPHTTTDIYGTDFNALPLSASCPMEVEEEGALQLTCIKKKSAPVADKGSMATFFNPFAKKANKNSAIKVAGEEERVLVYQFKNSLAIPVRVSQCRLEFDADIGERVKSPTLTFEVPPMASSYKVRFPFTMVPPSAKNGQVEPDKFEVKGIRLSCMNRSFFLPVAPTSEGTDSGDIAIPASNYPHRPKAKVEESTEQKSNLKLEVYPCQPNPKIAYAETDAAVDTDSKIEMGLTDGQVVATPLFRISNYTGPSGGGRIERLQITVVGIPGVQEYVIYDSEGHDATESAETSGDDFLRDLIELENPPAMKIRLVSVKSLNLAAINNSDESSPCQVAFQLAAGHNLGQKMSSETTITIRFKCSGQSTASFEVWRIREIPLNISYIKGPRIASLSLRPDLIEGAYFTDMCKILLSRALRRPPESTDRDDTSDQSETPVSLRIGLDDVVQVCSESILGILVVVNETNEDIVLSRSTGTVGGIEGYPLETLLLHNKVTSRIPVLVPRLPRLDNISELIDAIVERTTLVWETAKAVKSTGHFARGGISIPTEKLQEIIRSTPSIGPSLCQAPCQVDFTINGVKPSREATSVAPGQLLDISVSAQIASWVKRETRDLCTFTFEFFCSYDGHKSGKDSRDHMWCGKVSHSVKGTEKDAALSHSAKIILIRAGKYRLSGCIRIRQKESCETWLAPVASRIVVDPSLTPAQ